ncbi:MAG: hypothetical protein H3C36_15240, partial [Chitinophagaceae bacterium]|nr:hypothetical protein [Chitinophagaceae bacterium]
ENQFVGYVIHTLIQLSQGIAVLLRVQQVAQIQHSRQADNLLPEESVRGIETVNDKGHSFNQVLLAKSNELTAKIAELKRISDIMRQQGVTESSIEPTPTVRLMGSPGYSAVFHAYQHMKRQYNHLSHVVSLYDACISGQIRATWQIYELWCFLKLYHATQSEIAGMRPKAGSQTPFEALILQNGELHLPEDQPFQMESIFDNGRHLLVDLRYQAREADLKPDIVMRLTIDHTFTRKFVFDAKYRNYRGQGVDQFVQDVYGTARFKYLEKLPEQPKASFVFHTTYATGFDYWGEAPLYQAVLDAYNKDEANKLFRVKLGSGIEKPMKLQSCSFSGHRYGAISLIPGEDKDRQRTNREQLRKLLHLLLQYHCSDVTYYSLKKSSASLFRLENTCIYCGCTATEVADYKGRGVYYQCPKCQFLWVLHYCSQQKHSILKLMNYHLHRRQDPKTDEWLYECPECGSRFDPKWANPCDCSPPYSSPEVYQCDWEDGYVPEEPEYFRNAPFWSDVQEINNLGYKQISQPFIKDYIPF